MLSGLKWLRQRNKSELSSIVNGESTIQNTWLFKKVENAAAFAGSRLEREGGSVLIQTIEQIPQGVYYAVHVIGSSDGITPPGGCEKPPITLMIRPLGPDPRSTEGHSYNPNCCCEDCIVDPY